MQSRSETAARLRALVERPPDTLAEWARLVAEEADRLDAIEASHEHALDDGIELERQR